MQAPLWNLSNIWKMKKLFTVTLLLLLLTCGVVSAQCTPDPGHTTEFLYPSPTAPLPSGTVGSAYAQVITINVPMDTVIDLTPLIGFPFPAVSVTINSLELGITNGLPIGVFGTNNPGSGIILGGASGCIDIVGTPINAGQYVINIPTTLSVLVPANVPVLGGTSQNIPGQVPYNLEILSNVAVRPGSVLGFTVGQSLPNPTAGTTVIRYAVTAISDMRLEILNVAGARVYAAQQPAAVGDQAFRFDASDFAPGMYLYRLTDGKSSIARKMVVQ